MIRRIDGFLLFSENAKKLADFYVKKVGLKITEEGEMGENDENYFIFAFEKGSASLAIMDHSKVKGKNKNPERMIINLEVDDIKKEVSRLEGMQVKKTQDTYHVEGYGWVATFEDLDGNYFQLVQVRPN